MQPYKTSIVLTTIFDPIILETYYDNLSRFGRLDETEVIVIPDRKTPASAFDRCNNLTQRGLRVRIPSLEDQECFLRKVGMAPHLVPYDSDNRRNVGYLMALESGSPLVISIDDDNYCRPEEDFVGEHERVLAAPSLHETVASSTGFFNICSLLELEKPGTIYARGFPYYARHQAEQLSAPGEMTGIHINAGLWLRDPDIDAITWLAIKPRVTGAKDGGVILARNTWSPVNTQNTALRSEVLPAYYFVRMKYPIAGGAIDRYGDIFSGYFALACVKASGGAVRFGSPVADHRRNSHNYLNDATHEWACILVLEDLLPWLTSVELGGKTALECYRSLSHLLEDAAEQWRGPVWTDATRGYFHQMAYCMRSWVKACEEIMGAAARGVAV